MRKRITRWAIQVVALWAAQKVVRKIAERYTAPEYEQDRIAAEQHGTTERPAGPGISGTVTEQATEAEGAPAAVSTETPGAGGNRSTPGATS
jgi:hypothetical protein